MRPKDIQSGTNVYECLECGTRIEAPEKETCPDCGAELRRVGRPRDL